MAVAESPCLYLEELARFLAAGPSPDVLISFRPSDDAQRRFSEMLAAQQTGSLTWEEEHELDQFVAAELLLQLVNAEVHARRGRSS